jgi:hypothetical protein
MAHYFERKVDRRSRNAMVDFLKGHYRYSTANSWNGATSFANVVKVNRLGLTPEQRDKAYEVIGTEYWDQINGPIDEFTKANSHHYTICSNGRNSGYLVLHESNLKPTGHKSYCPVCFQKNYEKVPPVLDAVEQVVAGQIWKHKNAHHPNVFMGQPEIQAIDLPDDQKWSLVNRLMVGLSDCSPGAACGRCGHGRVNYVSPPKMLEISSCAIDPYRDYSPDEWPMAMLRERVELVVQFDRACDQVRACFIWLLGHTKVVEETDYVPVQRKTLAAIER